MICTSLFAYLTAFFSRLDLNVLKDGGVEKLVNGLAVNSTLKTLTLVPLRCSFPPPEPIKSKQASNNLTLLVCRLSGNKIAAEGAKCLAAFLATNASITDLESVYDVVAWPFQLQYSYVFLFKF